MEGYCSIDDLVSDFNSIDPANVVTGSNSFLQELKDSSHLKLLHRPKIVKAAHERGYSGLLSMFIMNDFFDNIRSWTNTRLKENGHKVVSTKMFRAYIGLEMAMSFLQYNDIKTYWKKSGECVRYSKIFEFKKCFLFFTSLTGIRWSE